MAATPAALPAADGAAAALSRRAAEIEPIADRLIGNGGSAESRGGELEPAARHLLVELLHPPAPGYGRTVGSRSECGGASFADGQRLQPLNRRWRAGRHVRGGRAVLGGGGKRASGWQAGGDGIGRGRSPRGYCRREKVDGAWAAEDGRKFRAVRVRTAAAGGGEDAFSSSAQKPRSGERSHSDRTHSASVLMSAIT